jgi:hypothetical protein
LFAELVEQHGALLADAPARPLPSAAPLRRTLRVPRRRLIPAGAFALALAVALFALVIGFGGGGGGGGTQAYAVVANPDGTVSVTVREVAGITGADEALRTLGVRAHVVRTEPGCPTAPGEFTTVQIPPDASPPVARAGAVGGEPAVIITPGAIPAGDTVVIGVRSLGVQAGLEVTGLNIGLYAGATPSCLKGG